MQNENNEKITIEAEMPISLEEIYERIKHKGCDRGDIIGLLKELSGKIYEFVKAYLRTAFENENVEVKVKKLSLLCCGYGNIAHGTACLKAELQGAEKELKKIAGKDKLFHYDWAEEKK